MESKPFGEVKVGDIATDYFNENFPVLDKGTLTEMFDKYGHRSSIGISDLDWPIDLNGPAIVKKEKPQFDGDISIFCYEDSGALVYKK